MIDTKRIRITLVRKSPNPLFEQWLKEFIDEAEKKDAKSQFQLKKALHSLQKYPLPLNTGRDCIILEGFGKGICSLLDQKLEAYIKNNMKQGIGCINNIIELSESFRGSDRYLKEKQEENTKVMQAVSASLVKDGTIPAPIVPVKSKGKAKKSKQPVVSQFQPFTMDSGTYEIVLIVDTQETKGKSKSHLDRTVQELNHYKIKYEIRRLSVGDFLWIAKDSTGHELVLPYIIERKRKDDLASSIKDGRFHEQKYRLKQCGIPNIIYMIENIGNSDQHLGLPVQNLLQAVINTEIHNGFQIKFTENNPHSVMYLNVMTTFLNRFYKDKVLVGCTKNNLLGKEGSYAMEHLMEFTEFNRSSTKKGDPTVQEIFIKQLLQLNGLSVDKALKIVELYPTPRDLILAFKNCPERKEGENLLADIQHGPLKKTIGPIISKTIYQLYTNQNPS